MFRKTSRTKGTVAAFFSLWLGIGVASRASAEAAFEGEKFTDKLKFGGDIRVRHEDFFNKSAGAVDRHRERLRLRFGVTGTLQDFTVGLRMASGTGEQGSTNQSFTNSWNQKSLYLDQAYLQWKVHESVKLTGGRMPNPMWRAYSSDIVWDTDINTEGYAQQVEVPAGERLSVFANFAQLPINEISGSNGDPWVFANQVGLGATISEETNTRVAVTYYGFIHERKNVFHSTASADSSVIQEANTRVAGSAQLASAFQIVDVTAELATRIGWLPVSLQGDLVRNVAPGNPLLGTANADHQTTGYQFGTILGKAKAQGTWEIAYFRKWVQANATISDWADADFGSGGTNRKGHIFWLAYAIRDYLTAQGKYFVTGKLNPQISSTAPYGAANDNFSDINRFQLDLVAKF